MTMTPWDGDDATVIRLSDGAGEAPVPLDTLHVWPFGISRNRLEQAVRELRLPVVVVREADEAEVVITLRNFYKQKAPGLREAEERGVPIFVLKSNTQLQMEACLTALYALDVNPNEAALREVEAAIGLVRARRAPWSCHPRTRTFAGSSTRRPSAPTWSPTRAAASPTGAFASTPPGCAPGGEPGDRPSPGDRPMRRATER